MAIITHIHPHLSIQYGHHHSYPPIPVNTVRPSPFTSTHTCQYSTAIITHIHPHLSIKHGHHKSHPLTPINTAPQSSVITNHICQHSHHTTSVNTWPSSLPPHHICQHVEAITIHIHTTQLFMIYFCSLHSFNAGERQQ